MNAIVRSKPWKRSSPPKKILVMRFQALGDTIITLPYLQSLKRQYPTIELHFLTREEVCAIPKSIQLFDKVITIGGKRNAKVQFIFSLLKLPWLWSQRYDAVIDLQHHRFSKIIRKLLFVEAWTEFDKYSPISAGERTRQTIEALWTWKIEIDTNFNMTNQKDDIALLIANGWMKNHNLVVLNPAGSFLSRNWPLNYYIEFAVGWLKEINANTQFVLLLLPSLSEKSKQIAFALGDKCIDLTGKANQTIAFSILQRSVFVLSEDSGLMHMAWVQGIPTLALFSSSRKDWSAPQGAWSACLDSSDLACGPCMLEVCQFGDNRCLVRYPADLVLQKAKVLMRGHKNLQKISPVA
jgi:heptosyltransferase-2